MLLPPMLVPLAIVAIGAYSGVVNWGGANYYVFGIPSSAHDFFYLLILGLARSLSDRRESYYNLLCWFMAGVFTINPLMQQFDFRPPGEVGSYDLYLDNITNALYIVFFAIVVAVLVLRKKIRFNADLIYLFCILLPFLAFNVLLVLDSVRDVVKNYALIYDMVYYAVLYMIVFSACRPINDFVRSSVNNIRGLLHSRHINI